MDFKKKMRQRLFLALGYILLGFTLSCIDLLKRSENYFLFSFGLTLITMGTIRLLQYRKITKNEQTLRKQELTETDERNRMIAERARSWAFSFSIIIAGMIVIVLSLLGYHDQALPFAWYVCGMITLYWIFWYIIQKKY